MESTPSNLPIALFLVPFIAALVVTCVGWYWRGGARLLTLLSLAGLSVLSVYGLQTVLEEGRHHTEMAGWMPPLGIEVVLDPLSAVVGLLVGVTSLLVLWATGPSIRAELPGRQTLFYATSLLLIGGMMGMVVAGDLFNLFVHVEVAAIASYAMVAAGGRGAPRAALRYLILGTLGASLYLLGVGFLFAATGSLNMADVAARLGESEPALAMVGSALILVGLGVKAGLFPLHGWMPAAYARAPIAAAALMAPLMTKVAAYALIRILFWVYGTDYLVNDRIILEVLLWAGAAAVVLGGVMAFVQSDLRRMLAYSSVAQVGLVAVGVGLANTQALIGGFLHIANDVLMKGALFLVAGVALMRFGVREVDDLCHLRGRAPWTGVVVVVAGLSLIGIPPLAGFFGKWYVLLGALEEQRWGITAALVIGSLATVGYVFRLIERMYFASPPDPAENGGGLDATTREGPWAMIVASVVFAVALVLLGWYNAAVVEWVMEPALPGE